VLKCSIKQGFKNDGMVTVCILTWMGERKDK